VASSPRLAEVPDGGGADEALKLSVSVVARIYRCNITHWDDPAIRALNPAIEGRLPHAHIQVNPLSHLRTSLQKRKKVG
jgi:hypothetical protein